MKTTVAKRNVQTYLLKTGLDKVFREHIPVKKAEAFQHYSILRTSFLYEQNDKICSLKNRSGYVPS